eukprot:scaffold1041_cov414-Prasinococcus_capsulatus_cf.AAC.9
MAARTVAYIAAEPAVSGPIDAGSVDGKAPVLNSRGHPVLCASHHRLPGPTPSSTMSDSPADTPGEDLPSQNPVSEGANVETPDERENPSSRGQVSERDPFSDAGTDVEEEEEEGEDLVEDAHRDYERIEALDKYEADGVDDDVEEVLDDEARAAAIREADRIVARRHAVQDAQFNQRRNRLPAMLLDEPEEDDEEERPRRRRRVAEEDAAVSEGGDDEGQRFDLEGQVEDKLGEWVLRDQVKNEIQRRFKDFLQHFHKNGERIYMEKIQHLCRMNVQSLEVGYADLSSHSPILAIWLADVPAQMLEYFHDVARNVVAQEYPNYVTNIHNEIFVRITDLPLKESIRDIRQSHLNGLVKVSGVVTRRTGVFPQLQLVTFDCSQCGASIGPMMQNGIHEVKPNQCPQCRSKGPFNVNVEQTVYRNYQKITLQESPGTVPAGRLPRQKEVILTNDLIDKARPGEELEVAGVYVNSLDMALNNKFGFPVFSTHIEANHLSKQEDQFADFKLTDQDRDQIHELARDPAIGRRIVKSIAPSIYGHENIKLGLALSLFGGQAKQVQGKHRLRGDINVLLLGDPGTAKSQFLKYVEKTAQRAVFTTGKGASAVGLTASVHKDPITREWTLEGGALVLADKGHCLIDEFDKMNDQDRVSIHEAMEQQSISISKAGIVTTLQARSAIIAAANPIGGQYDSTRTFTENVELTDPILSRFDVLCVVKDVVDPVKDEHLAKFVVASHTKSMAEDGEDPPELAFDVSRVDDKDIISQEVLRKYIAHAKSTCRPQLHEMDSEKIMRVYSELRTQSVQGQGIPIAVRHIESIIRMSEAHARMHFRDFVTDIDVDVGIRVLLESFISTQKQVVQKALMRSFRRYLTAHKDFNELLLHALQELVKDAMMMESTLHGVDSMTELTVKIELLEAKARELQVFDVQPFLESDLFRANGFQYDSSERLISKHMFEQSGPIAA